ncbi:neurofilament medium polypeptide [Gadus macrocephalus]|uniref:neurofilament medium polypeptide n=1 Tax=Gadus macrocephalus TaxID=80720 RepID=UPI0028CBA292|nr:neurofilament medium polypeptide [Gadus macrocephalus]
MSDDSSGVFGSRGERSDGAGEASGGSSGSQPAGGPDPERQSPHHRGNSSPESAGTTGRMERLAGRKVTGKACNVDRRERGGFARIEGREERTVAGRSGESVGRLRGGEGDGERSGRERTGRTEAFKTAAHDEGRSGSPSTHSYAGILQPGGMGGRARSDGPRAWMTSSTPTTSSRPAPGPKSTAALQRPPIRIWATPPHPPPPQQRSSQRPAHKADPLHRTPRTPAREPDPPWRLEARPRSRSGAGRNRLPSGRRTLPGDEDDEDMQEGERGEEGVGEEEAGSWAGAGGNGVAAVISPALAPAALTCSSVVESDRSRSRREKNRARSQRRRQRRREIWRQSRQQDSRQSSTSSSSSSNGEEEEEEEEEEGGTRNSEGLICAVCLDVYFSPYTCHPCTHVFCEPCLRTLAKGSPANTPCPLCRTTITHVFFQKELNQTVKTLFPMEYLSRKQNFQRASCAKWPLPSTRKLFRIFGGKLTNHLNCYNIPQANTAM